MCAVSPPSGDTFAEAAAAVLRADGHGELADHFLSRAAEPDRHVDGCTIEDTLTQWQEDMHEIAPEGRVSATPRPAALRITWGAMHGAGMHACMHAGAPHGLHGLGMAWDAWHASPACAGGSATPRSGLC